MADGNSEMTPIVDDKGIAQPVITMAKNSPRDAQQRGLLSRDIAEQPTTKITSAGSVQTNPNIETPAIKIPIPTSTSPTMPISPMYKQHPGHPVERDATEILNNNKTQPSK